MNEALIKTYIKSMFCVSLVLIGMVFSVFFDMFGITQTQDIQTALDNSKFLPKEIILGLIGLVFILGIYLIYLTINAFELKSKTSLHNSKNVEGQQKQDSVK